MENEEKQNLRQQQQRPMEQEPPPPPKCRPFPLTVPLSSSRPYHPYAQVVIAHRGASAHLPEHSLAGYRLALELGADYLEPDLVSTQDRHLVALHSLDLTTTTNVLEVYGQSKNQTASPYRAGELGYWVYDFTLAELKRLRLKQRLAKTQEDPNFGGDGNNNSLWYDRSTAFDGLFEVPTLSEILQLLQDWNEQVQPLWYNTETTTATTSSAEDAMLNKNNKKNTRQYYAPPPPRGLYAELKDYPWLLQDTKMNLIDIFFEHLTGTGTQVLWQHAVVQHMCETKIWNEHYEYKLPPLIIQAFEGDVLEDFTARWEHLAKTATTHSNTNQNTSSLSSVLSHDVMVEIKTGGGNETETTNTTTRTTIAIPVPPPPMILLLPYDKCRQEPVWFDLEEKYRHVLAGIGPDKRCFFDSTTRSSRSDDDRAATLRYNPFVMDKANKLSWVVHPWTERPEKSFFVTTTLEDNTSRSNTTPFLPSPFATVLEELRFLKCTVHVHGIFSESVDLAVRAMTMPCPSTMEDLDLVGYQDDGGGGIPSGDTNGRDGGGRGGLGYFFMTNDIPLGPVILFSFLSGILTALVVFQYCGTGPTHNSLNVEQPQQRRRRRPSQSGRRQSYLAPPTDINDDDDDNSIVRHRDNRVGVPLDNENDHEIL